MITLALDTATRDCAVALLDGERVLAEAREPAASHSLSLLPVCERLLKEAGLAAGALEAIAVGVGPGSFTGVRIGLSVAKALAFALGLPLAGVSTLRALAQGGAGLGPIVCPTVDALKGEVYTALYRAEAGLVELEPPAARSPADLGQALARFGLPAVLLGSGALRYRQEFERALGPLLCIPAEDELHRLRAAFVGRQGLQKLAAGQADDPHTLEPTYCRLSEAELAQARAPEA